MEKLHVDEDVNDVVPLRPETLLDTFKHRIRTMPDETAYVWWDDGERPGDTATYRELWVRATAIAAELQKRKLEGRSVVLLYGFEGLGFITAFWACIISGTVAVPTYPPDPSRLHRSMGRFKLILEDCDCALVLTNSDILKQMKDVLEYFPDLKRFELLATDTVDLGMSKLYVEPPIKRSDVAFLQYTSGSTGNPKGVMVTQGSLLFNEFAILNSFRLKEGVTACGWLPLYHDMGLIGFVVYAIFGGCHMNLMSPISFIKKPFRWLKLASDTHSVATGGPNFSYELCVRKITEDQMKQLDLSKLKLLFSGAEPVRPSTIENFLYKFSRCGFGRHCFMPVYGLAEATLLTAGHKLLTVPKVTYFRSTDLENLHAVPALCAGDDARPLTSCGQNTSGPAYPLKIVDPTTLKECPDGTVGEIWISGPTVAAGYYNKPEISQATFHAKIADSDDQTEYLRSGDLGFFFEGMLYVAGRQKDLIIINGRNHYPQDIELTVEKNPLTRPGSCAAFSIEKDHKEVLVCVVEANMNFRKDRAKEMLADIVQRILTEHELQPYAIAILKHNTVCKTSSGKIQRRACKDLFLKRSLEKVAYWCLDDENKEEEEEEAAAPEQAQEGATAAAAPKAKEAEKKINRPMSERALEIAAKITEIIGSKADKNVEIKMDVPFSSYGMSSPDVIGLAGELEEFLHIKLSPTLLYEYSTIELLSRYLAGEDMTPELPISAEENAEPLAIVGMSCRFPGASSKDAFWELIRDGKDAITDIPASRFDVDAYYDPNPRTPGKMYVRKGGFINDVDLFDPSFFNISRSEATTMDPQQRLLLTCVQEAFDDAGEVEENIHGSRTAVVVGVCNNDYAHIQMMGGDVSNISNAFISTGSANSVASNRISYQYDLQGPSVTVDTACSSSLVALDIAARYIRQGLCDQAVIGGANLILTPQPLIALSQAGFLSPDGHCKAFDASADGFVRSEGVAAVVVKPLSLAHKHGDRIYAVVRSTAVNQDGRSNGLTAPNPRAQQMLVREACAKANIAPTSVQYVECHGTGTALGDPIEVSALHNALCGGRDAEKSALLIGSVKSNIGHLEACAGMAGLMKLALSIYHKEIPPSILYNTPNPKIGFDAMPSIHVVDKLTPWPVKPAEGKKKVEMLIGGVSSFGFGGTNAHAILSSDPSPVKHNDAPEDVDRFWPLMISAHSENALRATVNQYAEWMSKPESADIYKLCPTAASRHMHKRYRAAFLGITKDELAAQMRLWLSGAEMDVKTQKKQAIGKTLPSNARKVCFVFCGQGPQWYGMARELLLTTPKFRDYSEELCGHFDKLPLDWDVRDEMSKMDDEESCMNQTKVAQVILFMFHVGIARHLENVGVKCDAVIGHSLGEIGAACYAGMLDETTASRLVFERATLMQETTGKGKMCAVSCTAEDVQPIIDTFEGKICISCYNGPHHIVVSGDEENLTRCIEEIKKKFPERHTQMLPVNYVFHSPQLDFAVPKLTEVLKTFYTSKPGRPDLTMYSTVTGKPITHEGLTPEYWGSQIRRPVHFNEAVLAALRDGCHAMVEIAPNPVLSNYVRAIAESAGLSDVLVQPTLMRKVRDRTSIANTMMALWAHGCEVNPLKHMFNDDGDDWQGVDTFTDLPERIWENQSLWVKPSRGHKAIAAAPVVSEPSARLEDCVYERTWAKQAADRTEKVCTAPILVLDDSTVNKTFSITEKLVPKFFANAYVVHYGEAFNAISDRECTANEATLNEVFAHFKIHFAAVLDCWPNCHDISAKECDHDWNKTVTATIALVNAVSRKLARDGGRCPIIVATHNAVATPANNAAIDPIEATAHGCVLTARHEYPELSVVAMDVSASEEDVAALATEIRAQVNEPSSEEPVIALHRGVKYAARLTKMSVPSSNTWIDGVRVRPEACYAITGGLGGLGLETANWLASKGAQHLLLLDKFPASERAEKRMAEIAKEFPQAKMEPIIMDIEDVAAVRKVIEDHRDIRGIFHYAGVLTREAFPQTTPESVAKGISAKVLGALNMHTVSVELLPELEMFVMASSISSLLPHMGQGVYSASNCFLNGLAERRRAMKLPAFAMQIGLLGNVGMIAALDKNLASHVSAVEGLYPTPASDIIETMAYAMTSRGGNACCSTLFTRIDWDKYAPAIPMYASLRSDNEEEDDEEEEEEGAHEHHQKQHVEMHSEEEISDWLLRSFSDCLHVEIRELDPNSPLSNYGLQSVTVMDITSQLSSWLGIKVSPNIVYDYPTVNTLSKHLAEVVAKAASDDVPSRKSKKKSKNAVQSPLTSELMCSGRNEPIAVIGMACKFPGHCNNLEEYWDLLVNGRDAVTEVPIERFDWRQFYDPDIHKPGKMNSKWGGFVDDIDKFDADFWSISPREADRLDPQQRMCLEMAWEALEDAGLVQARLAGKRNGLFVGLSVSDYGQLELLDRNVADAYFATGSFICMNANRLSYLLDFQGPSVALDTACSSSTVAIHLACNALRNGEADVCLAGGVNAILSPTGALTLTKTGALSGDGHCFTFDARANGFVRSEGCGMVVLKTLSRAIADGDRIHCLIDASSVNQDGRSQGLTAPNGLAQMRLYEDAYARAGKSMTDIAYIECHGTGTTLGDHIEVESLGQTLLDHHRAADDRVIIGSVKPNLGHLECASGMPSLMKVALAMEHDFIPPSIFNETPNPHIHFDTLPVRVSNGCEWPKNKPKLAGVSSFGFGGTNAHLVIEEAPAVIPEPAGAAAAAAEQLPVPAPYVVSVTSRSLAGLKETASVLSKFIASQTKASLRDICYSLLCRRDQHPYRACFVSRNEDEKAARAELVAQLEAYAATPSETLAATVPRPLNIPKVGFIFSGQGPQHFGMARQLLADCPEFARAIEEVDAVFKKQAEPFSVAEELARPEAECRLNETVCAQRVIFAIQYALAKCYAALGVKPSCVIGHSLGELAAACIVGLLTLTDAAILVYHRSAIMNRATGLGKMLAVGLSQEQCESFVAPHADKVAFAAINSPNSCVLSGEQKALETVAEALHKALPNAFVKFLGVDYAFHSPQMEALAKELGEKVGELNLRPAAAPNAMMTMYSTLTGARVNSGAELNADYWSSQVRKPVLFAKAIETAMEEHRADVFVELSPHPVLAYYVREIATARGLGAKDCAQIASMRRDSADEMACFWKSVATLHQWHIKIDWDSLFAGARFTRLPTYCWQKQRHWLANTNQCAQLAVGAPAAAVALAPAIAQDDSIVTPILETPTANVTGAEALSWSAHVVKPGPLEWEFDHCGFGSVLIPGVTYLEAALEASLRMHGPGMHILSDVRFHKPLFLGDATECTLHTSVLNTTAYDSTVLIKSCVDETAEKPLWQHHASIVVHKNREQYADVGAGFETDAKAILARCPTVIDGSKYYEGLWPRGLQLGPAFRSMKTVHVGKGETITEMEVPSHLHVPDYVFMPPVLDASMQCIGAALLQESEGIRGIYLPYHMDQLICWNRPTPKFYVHVIMREPPTKRALLGDVHAFTEDGQTLLYITNFECHYVEESGGKAGMFYEQQWKQIESRAPRHTAGGVPCIIFANSKNDSCEQLAKQLREAGQTVYIVERGTEAKEGRYMTAADTKESFDAVFEKILEAHQKTQATGTPAQPVKKLRVVYAWTLDCSEEKDVEDVSLLPFTRLVNSLQGLASVSTQLWVVTAGGRCITTGEDVRPCQSSIWGMAGIASQEYAQIKVVTCDLPAADTVDAKCVEHLAGQIIANGSGEDQLCLRAEKTYACRLAQASDPAQTRVVHTTLAKQPCRLEITKAGNLDNLTLMAIERGPLAADEVEIEVHASALNFRDVMRAMGLYPAEEDTPAVGLEASGVITRIGSDVKEFKVGDEVIGIQSGGFGTHIVCQTSCCVKKPAGWTDNEAAATTGVLMTAYVSLVWIAHIAKGEKVLVHSATGGVGLAALQICRVFGCEVFATCGRPDKRRYLVEHEGIPEDHIFNSRSVAFASEIRRMTNGRGVDVVLNSLMGEGLLRSFELLAPQGRFVEIGKRDIFENTPIGLRTFSRNTLLASVAVDEYFKRNKPFANKLLKEVVGKMADGTYKPIPQTPYKLNEAVRGFRHMASTTHIGKIVVTVDPAQEVDVTVRAPTTLSENATYVVVGFGGMGKEITEWLLKHGAKSIVSLTVFLSAEWKKIADDLAETAKQQYGATFRVIDCDITDQARVDTLFREELSRDKCPPVRGIIHAAGLVDDQLLSVMTEKSLRRVMAPKVLGTRALHEASLKLPEPLDFFICFSSIAALMGTMGQSNYAAANAYIDGLVAMRRAQGLPAFAFNWGPVMLGMTARLDSNVRAAMEAQGLTLLSRHDFLEQLGKVILTANREELPSQLAVIRMDWNKWAAQNAGLKTTRRFSSLVQSSGAQTVAGRQFLQNLFALASTEKRLAMVTEKIVKNIAAVLSLPTDGFPVERPLNEMGLDSMVANEVRVKIEQEIGIPMSIASLIGGPPVSKLAKSVLAQIETLGQEGALGSGEGEDVDVDVSGDAGPLSIAVDLTPEGADMNATPIFAVCPAGGQAPIFTPLANKLNRRFIALQKATGECESLNDLASAHVRSIRRHCPNGPYALIGHSLGGVIAYEIAAQLQAGGSEVTSVVMVDPINNETAELNEDPLEMAMLLCALGRSLCSPDALAEALAGRTGDALWEHFFTVCKIAAAERNMYRLAVNDIAAEIELFLHHEFTRAEKPVPYKLGVAIAADNHPRAVQLLRTDRSAPAWSKLTNAEHFSSMRIKGDHWSILADPNVSELAAQIAPML